MHIIYRILNSINNKGYVGQTIRTLKERWNNGRGYEGNPYLWNAINKYGQDEFYYDILMIVENNDAEMEQILANYWEDYYIDVFNYRNRENGYNLKEGGSNGRLSEEIKQKISQAHMGVIPDEATRIKMSDAKKGKPTWMKGKKHTAETKALQSKNHASHKDDYVHPMQGKAHSEISRLKMSQSHQGKIISDSTKQKMSQRMMGNQIMVGRTLSEDTKSKMSQSHIGINTWMKDRKLSEETKSKMSESHKGKNRKLTLEQELNICAEYRNGRATQVELAKQYGITQTSIYRILKRNK